MNSASLNGVLINAGAVFIELLRDGIVVLSITFGGPVGPFGVLEVLGSVAYTPGQRFDVRVRPSTAADIGVGAAFSVVIGVAP